MSLQAQNIYDDSSFFAAYSKLPRSQGGLLEAPEWPSLKEMISNAASSQHSTSIRGSRILDLGCGYGWFTRWARDQGAAYVRGIDLSEKMICQAKTFEAEDHVHSSTTVEFEVGNIQDLNSILLDGPGDGSFDMVYSSLAFHYVEDLTKLYRDIHCSLKKGGTLVFSVEHPIFSAPVNPAPDWRSIQDGGQKASVWPLNSYSEEGWRTSSWLGVEGIRKYHRAVETYVSQLINNGFVLKGLKDWVPSKEDIVKHPEWATERHRPYFLLISAQAQ